MINFGSVPIGAVLPIIWGSYAAATGASATLSGLAVTDIEIYKGTSMTQRASDAGYALLDTDGIDIDGTTGINGISVDTGDNTDSGFYAAGSFYSVVISAVTIDGQTVNFVGATFRLVAAEATAGVPAVNATQISGDSTAADNLESAFDDSAGPVPWLGILDQGTAQAATSTTLQLRSAAAFADDVLNGCIVGAFGSTQGYWQFRLITDYTGSSDTATVDAWAVTPSGTVTYKIFGGPAAPTTLPNVNVAQISGDATAADNLESYCDGTTPMPVNVTQFGGSAGAFSGGRPEVNTTHAAGTAWGSGAITAAVFAADAITAAKVASDVGSEIGTAVWATATRVLTAGTNLNDLSAAGVRAAIGMSSANLDTQIGTLATAANLATVAGYLDTEIAAILADTNELQTDWANGGRLDTILDARASQTSVDDLPTNSELATALAAADDAVLAAIAALNNLSAAQVNAEVVDALATDTYAEPGQAAPAATASLAAKINYLFKAWRNKKEQTATTFALYNDAGSTVDQKATVGDDGTTTSVGEIVSGP